jgi:hypothetical protein
LTSDLDELVRLTEFLKQRERAAARQALDGLDRAFPPSPARDEARRAVLDAINWYRRQVEDYYGDQVKQWLALETDPSPGTS